MNCQDCMELLDEYRRGGLPPDAMASVQQHLAECDTCRTALAESERLGALLRETALRPGNPDFAAMRAAVLQEVQKESAQPGRLLGGRNQLLLAAAAAGIVLVLGLNWITSEWVTGRPSKGRSREISSAATQQPEQAKQETAEFAKEADDKTKILRDEARPAMAEKPAAPPPAATPAPEPPMPAAPALEMAAPTGQAATSDAPADIANFRHTETAATDESKALAAAKAPADSASQPAREGFFADEAPSRELRKSTVTSRRVGEAIGQAAPQLPQAPAAAAAPVSRDERQLFTRVTTSSQTALLAAESARLRGDWTTALQHYQEIAESSIGPTQAEAQLWVGDIAFDQLKDYTLAAEAYRSCLAPSLASHYSPEAIQEIRRKLAEATRLLGTSPTPSAVP